MTALPSLTGKEVVAALSRAGFKVLRIKGSHHSTVVPVHSGEIIGPGLFAKILRDCDLDREQFAKLL